MDGWNECKKLGVAICHYHPKPTDEYHMPLCVGDSIHILEEHQEWYRGFNIRNRESRGIIPKSYVSHKDFSVEKIGKYDTLVTKDTAVVQEITSVLREWGDARKNLFINNKMKEYSEIRSLMLRLMSLRRDLMSRKLTKEEFKKRKLDSTSMIDKGNTLLELDLTVRNDEGDVINTERIGAIELYREHLHTVDRSNAVSDDLDTRTTQRHSLNLYVSVCNVICRVGDEADVIMALYDAKKEKFFSENCVIRWGQKGLPKDLDLLNNLRVLYSDLGSGDLRNSRESVFLVCQVVRLGDMSPPVENELRSIRSKNLLRRPFGVAALNVTNILNGSYSPDEDKQHFIPILPCDKKYFLETVIKEAVRAEEVTQQVHKGQGVWVSVKRLEGDLKQVREDYPHLIVGNTIIARKMGFPEVIMPSDVRNDFYVTINCGEFGRDSVLFADRNIEITMQVCSRDGKPLEINQEVLKELNSRQSILAESGVTSNVISVGGGTELQSEYKSVVYKHQDSPRWYETFKIAVPIEEFYNCHLKFVFKHKSDGREKPDKEFALSHVSFTKSNQTTLPDGDHDLLVYSIDTRKSTDTLAYLSLPSMASDLDNKDRLKSSKAVSKGPYTLAKKDIFQITTLSCSTKLTHNVHLLGLLNWRADPKALYMHLKNLMIVEGEEVVKFLQDTLDALFSILIENSETEDYDKPVFNALIFVIGLIGEIKFLQFKPVLELYIQENFAAPSAHMKLISVLKDYLDNADKVDYHDILYRSFKSIHYLMKFIIRSRLQYSQLNDNKASVPFSMSMKKLFQSIAALMCNDTSNALKVQGAVLKYLPSVISDVINGQVLDRTELSHLLIHTMHNIPNKRLTNQKLTCILDIVNSPLFSFAEPRLILLKDIVQVVNEEITSGRKALSTCAVIVSDVIHHLGTKQGAARDIRLLFEGQDLFRTVMKTVIETPRDGQNGKLVRDYTAIMIALLKQMKEEDYRWYMSSLPEPPSGGSHQNLIDFLAEIMLVFKDLIEECVFPPNWNEMIMMQNHVFLKALRCFSHTIKDKFTKPFEQQLWNNFFHCAISFLTQPALQLEHFSSAKRRKVIAKYGDMRREMGFEIRSMWYNLGQLKIHFIPGLVGPFLEMTLIPEIELRRATIPIFFDMMQCEFSQMVFDPCTKTVRWKGNFKEFENELITKMDAQVEGGNGDEQYVELFYVMIHEPCCKHAHMRELGLKFVEVIKTLMIILLEYRKIIHDENKENRMSCIVNLLNFYRDIDRQEMYIRYLHKLCDLHLECNNYTEAAHTLIQYSRLLSWSDEPLDHLLRSDMFPSAQSHRELKDALYHRALDHFDEGKMWEKGIALCKELITQYEEETFDYEQLRVLLMKQAEFYNKILKEPRYTPGYYRVSYYGYGFPSFLSNKTFVYRGKDYEQIADFTSRIRELFPNAKQLNTLNAPSIEVLESAGQHLQINNVTPVFEPQSRFLGKNVNEQILRYWRSNEVDKFSYSRPLTHTSDITQLWLERTDLRTEMDLPGIVRWFIVIEQHTYKVSPLMNAIETVENKNADIQALIEEHRAQPDLQVNTLNMKLGGICDPAVSGGYANYKPFFTGEYMQSDDECEEHVQIKEAEIPLFERLKEAILQQLELVSDGLRIFDEKCSDDLRALCNHLIDRFGDQVNYVSDNYDIKVPSSVVMIRKNKQVQMRQNRSGSVVPVTGSPILSELHMDRKMSTPIIDRSVTRSSSSGLFMPPYMREKSPSLGGGSKSTSRNSGRVISGYSTDSKDSSDSAEKRSDGNVTILTEQLTSARPPRPETKSANRSRPSSGNLNTKPKLQCQLSLPTFLNGAGSNGYDSHFGSSLTPVSGSASQIVSSVHIKSPVTLHPVVKSRICRSQSAKESSAEPVTEGCPSWKSLTNESSGLTSAGYNSRWESFGSLNHNDSFEESGVNMSSSPSLGMKKLAGSADSMSHIRQSNLSNVSNVCRDSKEPPPLPAKQHQSDSSRNEEKRPLQRIVFRQDSHKGKPPPPEPSSKNKSLKNDSNEFPPKLPEKRMSVGPKSSYNSH